MSTIGGLEVPGTEYRTVRCPFCVKDKPGCSQIASFMYGIHDAPCEHCDGLGLVKIEVPDHLKKVRSQ